MHRIFFPYLIVICDKMILHILFPKIVYFLVIGCLQMGGPYGILVVSSSNNSAHPSPGIIGIPLVPWDDMAVTMHDSLAGSTANIIPDIIPVWEEIRVNNGLAFFNEFRQCQLLF